MAFALGKRSLERLEGVNPDLVKVVKRAIEITPIDFTVVEGKRSLARQKELYAQGRTSPGKIVTWTMKSKHIDGLAVDIAPINGKAIDWSDPAKFNTLSCAMFSAAKELGVKLRWGHDWNMNGVAGEKGETDSPHFELI